jgi:4-carboxymuconolactone decarboxylase
MAAYGAVMTRLSFLHRDDLDDDQLAVWDGLVDSRATELMGPDGALIGPFNAFLHAPKIGRRLSSLGGLLRFRTSLDRRLSEVAICTVGAHWRAEFEFFAHAPMAVEHGVSTDVIDAMREGQTPDFEHADERAVYEVVTQLLNEHRVDDETYAAAAELLGEQGMVELVSTAGYYCLISMLLNLFDVALPEGADLNWPELAR